MSTVPELAGHYFTDFLPQRLTAADHAELLRIGIPVALVLRSGGVEERWCFLETERGFEVLERNERAECSFTMEAEVFDQLITGKCSPQWAFFTGKVHIDGPKLLALRVASLLEGIFRRLPYEAIGQSAASEEPMEGGARLLTDWQRHVVSLHLDPRDGSPFWLEAAARAGLRGDELRSFDDLAAFGEFDREAAATRPFRDFIPRLTRAGNPRLILGETGGTTGMPLTSAWQPGEFAAAFVDPLISALERRGVGALNQWLFVGPTGPHIIGRAADAVAVATTGTDPFRVDFDPRWHRKLAPGSFAAGRHLEHLVAQAQTLLAREQVDALFITPSVLERLLSQGAGAWIERLRLVHLGGQSITPATARQLREALPPGALLLNGYGNSLFGCIVEEEEPLTYRFPSERHVVRLCVPGNLRREVSPGETGQVVSYRFDETTMLLNVAERDEADHRGECFFHPRPLPQTHRLVSGGIY